MVWFRATSAGDDGTPPSYQDRLAQVGPGVPGHCPACDGLGYIDSIDIGHRYQIQHCKDCQHRWEYLFDGDGHVVGLTELDGAGQPVARSRVRPARTPPAPAEPRAPEPRIALPVDDGADQVLDLRDGAADASAVDLTDPTKLSAADWLRQSLRR